MNTQNLLQLADFLDTLPPPSFDMWAFSRDEHGEMLDPRLHECSTVCCAVGWGPAAGLAISDDDCDDWQTYSERVFGLKRWDASWAWCFSSLWRRVDNAPTGAAKRIRHLVAAGVPENWTDQIMGRGYIFAEAS